MLRIRDTRGEEKDGKAITGGVEKRKVKKSKRGEWRKWRADVRGTNGENGGTSDEESKRRSVEGLRIHSD